MNFLSSQHSIKQELPVARSSQKRRRIEVTTNDVDELSMDSDFSDILLVVA